MMHIRSEAGLARFDFVSHFGMYNVIKALIVFRNQMQNMKEANVNGSVTHKSKKVFLHHHDLEHVISVITA